MKDSAVKKTTEQENHGHRKRIKQRFLEAPIRSLPDYEILEMLLFMAYPRKDTKGVAKALLNEFGGLVEILNAEEYQIKSIEGVIPNVNVVLRLLKDFFSRLYLPQKPKQYHVISHWNDVVNYCKLTMGNTHKEQLKVLLLNKRNHLITEKTLHEGTIDKVEIYPREILYLALHNHATAIILVHNHPSGNPNPSSADIILTKQVSFSLKSANISLLDHVIVAGREYFSFKNNGLIN